MIKHKFKFRAGRFCLIAFLTGSGLYLRQSFLATAVAADAEGTRAELHGWGPFKFSMNRAEVAEAGSGNLTTNEYGVMWQIVEIGGKSYKVGIILKNDGTLIDHIIIRMQGIRDADERACLEHEAEVVGPLSQKYGNPDFVHRAEKYDSPGGKTIIYSTKFGFRDGSAIDLEVATDFSNIATDKCDIAVDYVAPIKQNHGEF